MNKVISMNKPTTEEKEYIIEKLKEIATVAYNKNK